MSDEEKQESRSFESSKRKAESFANNPKQTSHLADKAWEKLDRSKERLREVQDDIADMIRLVKTWVRGEYTAIPWKAIVAIIAALIYFVNPFDAIPDFIPFFGFGDDVSIVMIVLSAVRKDLEQFRHWAGEQISSNKPTSL
jgi:uncharacterized membrane protein YkvA (DUF1232 family)